LRGSFDSGLTLHVKAQDFTRLTLSEHFEWPATDFAIRREPLSVNACIEDQIKFLTAKGTLNCTRYFHAGLSNLTIVIDWLILHELPRGSNDIAK
jgi:hypothetical protein